MLRLLLQSDFSTFMSGEVGEVLFLGGGGRVRFRGRHGHGGGLIGASGWLRQRAIGSDGWRRDRRFDGRRGSGLASLASPKVENVRIVVYRPRREPRKKA